MRRTTLLLSAIALLSAWGRDPDAAEQSDLAALRGASASFQNFETARAAGWSAQVTPCMSNSMGGLGIHVGNPAIIDGSVRAERPELLLYEPQPNGGKRLVAAEYVVPLSAWTSAEPPRLFGRAFKVNAAFGIWTLHVWAWKDNPSGLYADWNPRVSCQHAE